MGWSDFGPSSSFTAADVPSEPEKPALMGFSSTSIQLEFNQLTIDDGGLPLTGYQLEISADVQNGFTQVLSYAGESSFTLEAVRDSLIEGTIYTIRWFATNSKGDGIRSDELLVALMDSPVGPTTIQKLSGLSGLTSITVQWSSLPQGVAPGGEILGYKLYIKNPNTSV